MNKVLLKETVMKCISLGMETKEEIFEYCGVESFEELGNDEEKCFEIINKADEILHWSKLDRTFG